MEGKPSNCFFFRFRLDLQKPSWKGGIMPRFPWDEEEEDENEGYWGEQKPNSLKKLIKMG